MRPPAPQRIAFRRLRPHHVGPEVGEQFRGVDAALIGEVEHPYTRERAFGHWWTPVPDHKYLAANIRVTVTCRKRGISMDHPSKRNDTSKKIGVHSGSRTTYPPDHGQKKGASR
jgi:hypothetical protein